MNRDFLSVFGCIAFTVYGQVILKWRLSQIGRMPVDMEKKVVFLLRALIDPYILSGFMAAFVASLFWMAAMTKLEISVAYPFMSLAFVLVLILSAVLLHEPITIGKVLGMGLICTGIIVTVKF